jgi:predicted nucleic acid-binding protein
MYVDTSVAVLLCAAQPASPAARARIGDEEVVTCWATKVECASAIARLHREGLLADADEAGARKVLGALAAEWREVAPSDSVREGAVRLLRVHPLRAADALHLAAALAWVQGRPGGEVFATGDRQLGRAAQAEGFTPWSPFAPTSA